MSLGAATIIVGCGGESTVIVSGAGAGNGGTGAKAGADAVGRGGAGSVANGAGYAGAVVTTPIAGATNQAGTGGKPNLSVAGSAGAIGAGEGGEGGDVAAGGDGPFNSAGAGGEAGTPGYGPRWIDPASNVSCAPQDNTDCNGAPSWYCGKAPTNPEFHVLQAPYYCVAAACVRMNFEEESWCYGDPIGVSCIPDTPLQPGCKYYQASLSVRCCDP